MAHHNPTLGHTPSLHEHADDWHSHSRAEGIPQQEHAGIANASVISLWVFATIVAVGITVAALWYYFQSYTAQYRDSFVERDGWTRLSQPAREYKATAREQVDASLDAARAAVINRYKSRGS